MRSLTIVSLTFAILISSAPHASLDLLLSMDGEASGDQFGISVSSAGDVNGDGYHDLIVGANANDDGGLSAGKAYVYMGGPAMDAVPDVLIVGDSGDFLGVSVSSAGDVNDDNYDDVIVGAHFNSDSGQRAGKAAIYLGGNPMDTAPDVTMHGERERDYFGISVSGAGDVNNDGFGDVVVGAYKHDFMTDTDTLEDAGRAYIYCGGPQMDDIPELVLTGSTQGERFGYSVSSTGDVNDDGYDDVIIGAYSYDEDVEINLGRAYLFHGGDPMDSIPDLTMTGEMAYAYFGWSVSCAGDVNHDGHNDLIVGAYGQESGGVSEAGKAYLYWGGPSMDDVPDGTVTSEVLDSVRFGISVSGAGDVNGDYYGDLLIGADSDDEGGTNAGKTHVFFCDSLGPSADTSVTGEEAGARFGRALSGAGDVNTDGNSDILVGAWGIDSYTGKAYVYGIPAFYVCGDCNGDGRITIADATYLVAFIYRSGPAPLGQGDVNLDGRTTIGDATYIVGFIYRGGPEPCNPP